METAAPWVKGAQKAAGKKGIRIAGAGAWPKNGNESMARRSDEVCCGDDASAAVNAVRWVGR